MSNESDKKRPDPARVPTPRPTPPTPSGNAPSPKAAVPPSKPTASPAKAPSANSSKPSLKSPAAPGSAPSTVPRAARPTRPQTPAQPAAGTRLEGVLEADAQDHKSIESVLPSGLSTSTYLPHSRRDPELERRLLIRRKLNFRLTVIPSALVLCLSTLLMGSGWFLLDPTSAVRDNTMGVTIPVTLFALSVAFGVASALLMSQAASLRRQCEPAGEN